MKSGYAYLRGVRLLFLPNFPGGMFFWGATLIRNSRVYYAMTLTKKAMSQNAIVPALLWM